MKELRHRAGRLMRGVFAVLSLALCIGKTALAGTLEVHFLNVGQGDSTLIRQGDHAMLIDAGGEDDREAVLNYLFNKQGLTELDYVVGTHPHEDHIGSLDSVIEAVPVGEVLLPDVTASTDTFLQVLNAIEQKGMGITIPAPGDTFSLGEASVTVLGPVKEYGEELNDWSVALKVTYGQNGFLFTGDAESAAEKDIAGQGFDLGADVFQAGHHGSDTANSDVLLDAVCPSYVVISCGSGNSYGHPCQEALDRFRSHGAEIFRTDGQGTIVAVSDGAQISWSTEPSQDWTAGSAQNSQERGVDFSDGSSYGAGQQAASSGTSVEVHITETGSKYHLAGCQYLKNSDIVVSLESAKARGLEPCSKCRPPQ